MNFNTFIIRLIRTNIQKYYMFILSTIFSMSVFFIFINLWYTDGFTTNTNGQMHTLMVIAATITIIFSIFIISYVHWYLMRDRAKSFSVLLSYGMTPKDLRKLILFETLIIFSISLFMAFITGSIFSKLFFMCSIKLLMIENHSLKYQLTYEAFVVTTFVFILIFAIVLLLSLYRMAKKDLISLSKSKKDTEMNSKGSFWIGILGLVMVIISILSLYLHNRMSTEDMTYWILGAGIISLLGIYLLISHFSRLLYGKLKKNKSTYYRHLLEASEFAMEYRQNRKTLFVLTLLTFGTILFISVTYTLNHEAIRLTNKENPHDLYYQEIKAMPVIKNEEVIELAKQWDLTISESKSLPFIYMKAPNIQISGYRNSNWIPVVSETDYNSCFAADSKVTPGEAIQIIFESSMDHHNHYFNENIQLANESSQYTLKSQPPVYQKILNRYIFTQSILIIVDDADYQTYRNEASDLEQGTLYMYRFEQWKDSKKFSQSLLLKNHDKINSIAESDPMIFDQLIERYGYSHLQVNSKINYYTITKMQGSFSLYIMGFVSILFTFCILITYCFKVFMCIPEDMERFRKLNGIGLKRIEQEKLIRFRVRLLMFVPTIIGSILATGWICALNFRKLLEIELSNITLFCNTLGTEMLFIGIIWAFYHFLMRIYIGRIK